MSNQQFDQPFEGFQAQLLDGIERNLEAQSRLLEAWSSAVTDATDDELVASGATGMVEAYDTWLDATERMAERATDAAAGDDVDVSEFRDIWLRAANESLNELMGTEAFARMTGENVSEMLDMQRQTDEAIQENLESMGFATTGHVEEVGARLVELERRQHDVERKLDAVLEHLEDA